MQQYKPMFRDPDHRGTVANIQGCLRLNDLDEIGDGTHLLHFDMMGLFSFRVMSVREAIDFWFDFLREIELAPDVVTIHPDRMDLWRDFYAGRDVEIRPDAECIWTDGEQGGYCTEFYLRGVEIGNIVNTGGDCIDVGFGLDRLLVMLDEPSVDGTTALRRGVEAIISSGYTPSNKQQGYVLRRLLRQCVRQSIELDHPFFQQEKERQFRLRERFSQLYPKHVDKSPAWWMDTHGIDIIEMLSDREKSEKSC